MELAREHLTILLNALHDTGSPRFTVAHPGDQVGALCEVNLGDPTASTVRILADEVAYADARDAVDREHGAPAVKELPGRQPYINAFLAGGLIEPANTDAIAAFLDRYGSPDLTAGHRPVVAGFDTNLLPWGIADVLELSPGREAAVNGFALATGVRDELDWDYKRSDTGPLEDAFGPEFGRLWNQPAGSNREGRLGETHYRRLRDSRYADEVECETGDEAIVDAYDAYQRDGRKDVLLFSNDRDFVERARSHTVLAQRVEFPRELPETLTGSWETIADTLYVLTVLFGALELPKVTLYGVWQGKGGGAWHDETIDVECRSPKVKPLLKRDLAIVTDASD